MAHDERQEIAPEEGGQEAQLSPGKGRQAFRRVRRELSEEELGSPAVQRLLIAEVERLERENDILANFKDRYYEADKVAAVLKEKLNERIAQDIIFGLCLTVGSALMSIAPALWAPASSNVYGKVALIMGGILIIGGIASKVVRR